LEVWCGKKPNLSYMWVFGSTTYMHVHKENNHKLELKSFVYMFFRYCVESNTYQLWELISWKIKISHDDFFDEEFVPLTPIYITTITFFSNLFNDVEDFFQDPSNHN
jgi:hypothetical protein